MERTAQGQGKLKMQNEIYNKMKYDPRNFKEIKMREKKEKERNEKKETDHATK